MNDVPTLGAEGLFINKDHLKLRRASRGQHGQQEPEPLRPGPAPASDQAGPRWGDSWPLQSFVACAVPGELRAVNICPELSEASCSGCS